MRRMIVIERSPCQKSTPFIKSSMLITPIERVIGNEALPLWLLRKRQAKARQLKNSAQKMIEQ